MKLLWAAAAALLLHSAEASAQDQPTVSWPAWADSDVAWAAVDGRNTVTGTALLRTRGGEPRTCAALEVTLVPQSAYADERISRIYGVDQQGYRDVHSYPRLEEPPVGYIRSTRTTRCDGQGYFQFDGVPDGSYYVISIVTWTVPGRYVAQTQGGALMAKVSVKGGQTRRVVLGN
ncbi:hypothetical protein WP12_16920 [Sphingomonas sp. SRS2]|nr:hypothetical protein WP12_16920 [Sphingomonas sp. SRS2]